MPQAPLDRAAIDTRVEPVGRTTVAQRRHTRAGRDPCARFRLLGDLRGGAEGPRLLGLASRPPPRGWPVEAPGGPSRGAPTGGEQRRTILAAFARLDAEPHALTCNSGERQTHDCTDAQACGIRGHPEDTVPGLLRRWAQALQFLHASELGELGPPRPWWEGEGEDIPTPRLGREALEPCGRWVAGTPGQAPLDEELVQVGTHLCWTHAIRSALVARGSARDSGHGGLWSCRSQPLPLPIAEHLGT
jgi:hypothetical protein